MFTWIKGSAHSLILTLYPSNITLNSSASNYFQDVRWCMIGIDHEDMKLGIRPVSKHDIDLHLVDKDDLHKISIGKGYARISNKSIIEEISNVINQEIDGLKIPAIFDEKEKILIADLAQI